MAMPVPRRGSSVADRVYLPAIWRGLQVTSRRLLRNLVGRRDTVTQCYPEARSEYAPRWRGPHRLLPGGDGELRCVACFLCATACPARCIHIVAGEHDDPRRARYPVAFEIDEARCVYCGMCVEACPCDAIRMDTQSHPQPVLNRATARVGKEALAARQAAPVKIASAAGPRRVESGSAASAPGRSTDLRAPRSP